VPTVSGTTGLGLDPHVDLPDTQHVRPDGAPTVWDHRNHVVAGFTKKYGMAKLLWYELHFSTEAAIQREKAIKEWKRAWNKSN